MRIRYVKCELCGHAWVARAIKPYCPRCHRTRVREVSREEWFTTLAREAEARLNEIAREAGINLRVRMEVEAR